MIVVLVGGPAHLRHHEVPPNCPEVVVPDPVPSRGWSEDTPWIPPFGGYRNVHYYRQVVRDERGVRCDRLFFCCAPEDISAALIAEGLRGLRGAQLERLT